MPVTKIIRIEELSSTVASTLIELNRSIVEARKTGIDVELPDKVDFQLDVIFSFEALQMTATEAITSEEAQGGKTVQTGNSQNTSSNAQSSATNRTGENIHRQSNAENSTTENE